MLKYLVSDGIRSTRSFMILSTDLVFAVAELVHAVIHKKSVFCAASIKFHDAVTEYTCS